MLKIFVSDLMSEKPINTNTKNAITIQLKYWRGGILDKITNIAAVFRGAGL